jgi:hypothetical protein
VYLQFFPGETPVSFISLTHHYLLHRVLSPLGGLHRFVTDTVFTRPLLSDHTDTTMPKKIAFSSPTARKHSRTRQTVQISGWGRPQLKAELSRIAEQAGVSFSQTVVAALEAWVRQQLHSQHAVLLETIIDQAIGKHMRAYSNRLAVLLVRSLFNAEQTRSYAINILGRMAGMTEGELTEIRHGASDSARANITRISPQLKTLIEAVQKELLDEVNTS